MIPYPGLMPPKRRRRLGLRRTPPPLIVIHLLMFDNIMIGIWPIVHVVFGWGALGTTINTFAVSMIVSAGLLNAQETRSGRKP